MRAIDADAFAEFLKDAVKQLKYENIKIDGLLTVADVIEAVISELDGTSLVGFKNAPTIEPERTGRWIIRDNPGTGWYRITCSECGEDVTATAPCIGFFPNAKVNWDYCPNCGSYNSGDDGGGV